jgi:integrase
MSYKLLPNGKHQWRFRLGGAGTPLRRHTDTDFKKGEKFVRDAQYEYEHGIEIGNSRRGVTFFDICDGYEKDATDLPTCTKQKKKTIKSQITCFKKIIPNYRLVDFNIKGHEAYNAINRWIKVYRASKNRLDETKPISPSSVRRKFNTLRAIFNWSIANGQMTENPCKRAKKPKAAKTLPRFLSNPEIKNLVGTARRKEFVDYCTVILNTGMRPSEALSLQIEHIDLTNRIISGFPQKNGELAVVQIKESFVAPLRKMIGERTTGSLLNYNPGQLREDAEYGIKKAGINKVVKPGTSKFTIYGLRHTFASHLLMETKDMAAVSRWLRNSIEICNKHYGHLTQDYLVAAGDKIDLMPKIQLKVVGGDEGESN